MIKVILVSDSTITYSGVREVLSGESDFKIVKRASGPDDAILLAGRLEPDIILLCCRLLIDNGTGLVRRLKKLTHGIKVVVFDSNFAQNQELGLVREGVAGIINSNCTPQTFVKALRKVHAGEYWLSRELFLSFIPGHRAPPQKEGRVLTNRESEILYLIMDGYRNHDISHRLFISKSTVKTHINNIYRKLKVNDRMQAVFYANKIGLSKKHFSD